MSTPTTITLTVSPHYEPPAMDTDVLVFCTNEPAGFVGTYVGDDDEGHIWINTHGMRVFGVRAWAEMPCLEAV